VKAAFLISSEVVPNSRVDTFRILGT
jgi:hypothetical protein